MLMSGARRAMPVLFVCAALIALAVDVGAQFLPPRLESAPVFSTLSGIVVDAVQYFCLTRS
jgi:hypothetical protein